MLYLFFGILSYSFRDYPESVLTEQMKTLTLSLRGLIKAKFNVYSL